MSGAARALFGVLLLLGALLLAASPRRADALSVQVEPREEQCTYEEMQVGQRLDLDVEVIRGGLLDIKIRVAGPNNQVILERLAFFNRQVCCLRCSAADTAGGLVCF